MSEPLALAARRLEGPSGAPPLLVMHGLLGSSRNWQAHGKALARKQRIWLLDLRNHGSSPWSAVMDYPSMAADVVALADREGLERFALLGHSMGGKVAMAVALTVPERVTAAVVADIAPVAYGHDFKPFLDAMRGLDLAAVERRATADEALSNAIEDAAIRQFLLQNLDFDAAGKAFWKPNLEVLDNAMTTLTGWPASFDALVYEGPVLCLHGGRSPYVDEAGETAFRRIMPAVAFETLDGAGHWLHAEQPLPFLRAVQRFFDA